MPTDWSAERWEFGEVSGRVVVAWFDGGSNHLTRSRESHHSLIRSTSSWVSRSLVRS